ncbi:MAG: helix-turn-helix transcriptional regulator [Xanthobacteraceae bacterium]
MTATQSGSEGKIEDVETLFADRKVNGVLLDRTGRIVYVNAGWKAFAEEAKLALPDFGIGQNYLRYCAFADEQSARIIDGITQLLSGRLDCLSYIYPCHSPTERQWFVLLGFSRVQGDLTALLHLNITGLMPKDAAVDPAILTDRSGPRTMALQPDHYLKAIGDIGQPESVPRNRCVARDTGEAEIANTSAIPYKAKIPPSSPLLSKRQQQVLDLMAKGMSNVEIGRVLAISPNTVKIHVSGILARLGLPSRAQAIHWTLTRRMTDHSPSPNA